MHHSALLSLPLGLLFLLGPVNSSDPTSFSISCHSDTTSPEAADVRALSGSLSDASTNGPVCYDPATDGACVFLAGSGAAQATYCAAQATYCADAGEAEAEAEAVSCVWFREVLDAVLEKCVQAGKVAATVKTAGDGGGGGGVVEVGNTLIAL